MTVKKAWFVAATSQESILCDATRHVAATRRDAMTLNVHKYYAGRATSRDVASRRGVLRQFVNIWVWVRDCALDALL